MTSLAFGKSDGSSSAVGMSSGGGGTLTAEESVDADPALLQPARGVNQRVAGVGASTSAAVHLVRLMPRDGTRIVGNRIPEVFVSFRRAASRAHLPRPRACIKIAFASS